MGELDQNLKKQREKAGLSKAELARQIGMPYTTYNNYETGFSEPKLEIIQRIADALGIDRWEIIGFSPTAGGEALQAFFEFEDYLRGFGYFIKGDSNNGYLWVMDKQNNCAYEITESDLNQLQKSITSYTKFQLNELFSRMPKKDLIPED